MQCFAEKFTCQQNLEEHNLTVHMIKKCFKFTIGKKNQEIKVFEWPYKQILQNLFLPVYRVWEEIETRISP